MSKVFVGSLAWATTSDDLRNHFAQYKPTDAVVINDRETGRSRGFGFVTFDNDEARQAAITQLDNTELNGRNIKVDSASDRPVGNTDSGYQRQTDGGYQRQTGGDSGKDSSYGGSSGGGY